MDLAASIKLIQDATAEGLALEPLDVNDPRKNYYDTHNSDPASRVLTVDKPPAPRNHTVLTVDDLINAGLAAKDDARWNGNPVVWHHPDGIVLLVDDRDRRDRVTLNLTRSPQFQSLKSLVHEPEHSQGEFLILLRLEFGDCVDKCAELVQNVRKIRFRSKSDMGADLQASRGRESMDRTVEEEAYQIDGLPEQVQISVPIYSNTGENKLKYAAVCALDINIGEQMFVLTPLPGEIERIVDEAQANIRARIQTALPDVPIFYGTP